MGAKHSGVLIYFNYYSIIYRIMHHPYIEQVFDQYTHHKNRGGELIIDALDLRSAAIHRSRDVGVFLPEPRENEGQLIRARHDIAGFALRLSILSRAVSPHEKDWFDVGDNVEASDRGLVLEELSANDSLPPEVSPAAVGKMIFAARAQLRTSKERRAAIAAYATVWRDNLDHSTYAPEPFAAPDAIFVQAFGRDSIADRDLPQIAQLRSRHDTDTTALAALLAQDFVPGPSNEALAMYMKHYIEHDKLEAMAQWEVAAATYMTDPDWYHRYSAAIHVLWPRGKFYPTYDVKEDSVAALSERGLYIPVELAHPAMLPRAEAIIKQQGVIADLPEQTLTIPYDPDSTQPWVRSRREFLLREAATRVHHLLFKKVRL